MLKKELIEKLKDIDDNADINETILAMEDFAKSSELDVTKLTIEDYKNVLEKNETIKGYNQSQLDSAISKAINSHDDKFQKEKLPSIIEEELKKRSNEGLTKEINKSIKILPSKDMEGFFVAKLKMKH